MKKLVGLLLVVFMLGFCSNALAMDLAGKFGLSGKGEIGMPMGDLADGVNTGFGFGASGEYFINDQLAVGAYFDYDIFGTDAEGLSAHIMGLGGFFKYVVPTTSNVSPYLKASAGFYQPKFSGDGESMTFDMKFGFGVGGGVMFKASENVLVGGEIMFHDALVKDAEADIDGGTAKLLYDWQYIQFNFGVTFLLGSQ